MRQRLSLATLLVLLLLAFSACSVSEVGQEEFQPVGTPEAPADLAYVWRREGGFAGFCDVVSIYLNGEATIAGCRSDPPEQLGTAQLSSAEQATVQDWVERLAAFEKTQTDPAIADALTIRLTFYGRGVVAASEADFQAMSDLAQLMTSRLNRQERYGDLEQAETALRAFFDALAAADYEDAVGLYDGSYEALIGYNPDLPASNAAALWQRACEVNGFVCLPVRRVVESRQIEGATVLLVVEFETSEGELFVRGPCCGADATEEPPTSQFAFNVRPGSDGRYRVVDLPVYIP